MLNKSELCVENVLDCFKIQMVCVESRYVFLTIVFYLVTEIRCVDEIYLDLRYLEGQRLQ